MQPDYHSKHGPAFGLELPDAGGCLIQESLFDGYRLSIALVACSAVINRQAAASLDVLSYVRGGPADA